MSKESRNINVYFVVNDYERLPEKNGEQMFADDVVEELSEVVDQALKVWYAERGKDLLAVEPGL